ncbi:STAS/SEC14 domain-containing protein [Pontibacter silvestris]|uniref:STAS/SEC14 domain-containing protein n=1 Tax=Pontibacter silvestris TaxID=2305183 RepID=A0ABW4X342_9BACT|nr:STAS/SEC14 domain-containing protein [Pontibacter silvestris]MCC9137959.1 STAS/SEC14 domain-containing protein [Pontibacter silvestris]
MLQLLEESKGDLAAMRISGQVDKQDYDVMLPLLEEKIKQYKKIRVYAEVQDVDEYSAKALWEEIRYDFKHANNFSQVVIVGDKKWLDWITSAASPFTSADVKYFETSQRTEAINWLES